MFFESIESRLSSVISIESFGKCFIIPSAREARFVPCVELFKACKKCFFVSVTLSQNRAVFSVFFPPLFFFLVPGGGQTKTQIQSQIEYTLNAHKNGGYKRKNFLRERGDERVFFFRRSFFFLFFLCFGFFLKRRG
jgi:hypothetical protein